MADAEEIIDDYTYREYQDFPEGKRFELIDGEAYMMASPSDWHQRMIGETFVQLWNFFNGKTCQVRLSPFDVRLFPKEDDSDNIVVQPDIMVICDKEKLSNGKSCKGAPDLIIEILSPSSRSMDLLRKRRLYEKAGVKEYWVVGMDVIFKYVLTNGVYTETRYVIAVDPIDVPSDTFNGCTIRFVPDMEPDDETDIEESVKA